MALLRATPEDVESFLAKVEPLASGCLYWTGARSRGSGNRKWYPSFWMPSIGQTVRGHRFSSEVFNCEECPPGHHRDHECCFSMCVNPEHIRVRTREENQVLKIERQIILPAREHIALLRRRHGLE